MKPTTLREKSIHGFFTNATLRQKPSVASFFIAYGDKKRRRIHAPQSRIAIATERGVASRYALPPRTYSYRCRC